MFEFYPGTGADDVMEKNIVNAPLIPLWKYSGGGREARTAPGGGARAGTNQRPSLVEDAMRAAVQACVHVLLTARDSIVS